MRLSHGDQEIFPPENLDLLCFDKFSLYIHRWKVENQKMVIMVTVDFRPQVYNASTVLNIKGMKMIVILQSLQFLFSRPEKMRPAKCSEPNRFNHMLLILFNPINLVYDSSSLLPPEGHYHVFYIFFQKTDNRGQGIVIRNKIE